MRLIAKKPCSFCGRQFYIGDEIPSDLVVDVRAQEKMGVIIIANKGVPGAESSSLFTLEQVEKTVAEAVDNAVNNTIQEMEQKQKELQEATGVLQEEGFLHGNTVIIPVKEDFVGDNEQQTALPAAPEEIQQVFSIMQMSAEEGAKEIAKVKSENVLILIHAADSRKTIKNAAKEQADRLFSVAEGADG